MPNPDIPTEMAAVQAVIDQLKAQILNMSANLRQKKNRLQKANKRMSHLKAAQFQVDEYQNINP